MANPDRTRKLLVRSALVTSATIATFVGAQNLAMLDATRIEALFTPSPEAVIVTPLPEVTTPVPVVHAAPNLAIQQAAPSIIILRRSGQAAVNPNPTANPGGSGAAVIQPPAPSEVAAPAPVVVQQGATPQIAAPVVVQQPVIPSSRSSR